MLYGNVMEIKVPAQMARILNLSKHVGKHSKGML